MIYPAPLLPDLLVGWQKVADRYNMPIYVFQTGDTGSRGWPLMWSGGLAAARASGTDCNAQR
jgi:hypothetical protein